MLSNTCLLFPGKKLMFVIFLEKIELGHYHAVSYFLEEMKKGLGFRVWRSHFELWLSKHKYVRAVKFLLNPVNLSNSSKYFGSLKRGRMFTIKRLTPSVSSRKNKRFFEKLIRIFQETLTWVLRKKPKAMKRREKHRLSRRKAKVQLFMRYFL